MEQTIEWQSPLYVCFVDFEKAFDSIDRQAIWNILANYGVPQKIIKIIQILHQQFSCQVIHNGKLSTPFQVTTGVRQGCMLSPLLFLVVLDWVTKKAYHNSGKGITWTFSKKLEDLEFADDLALLSHRLQDLQQKVKSLSETAQEVGLKINIEKTKVLRTNTQQQAAITLNNQDIEDVEEFVYLGSRISKTGGTEEDIRARIRKAQQSFAVLRPVWKATAISHSTKLRIFNSNVKSVLLYGSETWRSTETTNKKLQTFVNKCLRQIFRIKWQDKVTNVELWRRAKTDPIEVEIKRRKWRWIGHTLRKDPTNTTRHALDWNPQGKRKRGRPKQTWRRSTLDELKPISVSWATAKKTAMERSRWRTMVEALCSSRSQED